MVNPDVDGCTTKTLNHQKILRKMQEKILKTKRILKLKHKQNWSPSFAFTVACKRRQFTPLAAVDPNSKDFHWQTARGGKILEIPSFDKKFSGLPSKNISFTATIYWNSINSCLILAVYTPVVSSWRSYALPLSSVNAVNDGSLPTNISEDAQQSSGTYKISITSFVHTCACVFFFSWEFGNVCHWKGLWGKSNNCFRREKTPKCSNVDNQLFNKLNKSGTFLLLLSPNASEND